MSELGQETGAATAAPDGMDVLARRPDVLAALERAALRAAERAADMGDVGAETLAGATDALAEHAARHGLPADVDGVAALLAAVAKTAARRARAAQRKQWAPVRRAAHPSDAPNVLERMSTAALLRRAGRYSMGALSTREQATAVLDRRAAEPSAVPMATRTAMLTRDTVRGDRVAESVTVGAGMAVPRHTGATVPSAESAYWRAEHAYVLAESVRAAVGAPTVEGLHRAYRAERVRKVNGRGGRRGDVLRVRRVGWAAAAGGAHRGTFQRETRRAAGRVPAMGADVRRADAWRMVRARETAEEWARAVADGRAPLYAGSLTATMPADVRPSGPRAFPWTADLVLSCEERPAVAPNYGAETPAEERRRLAFGSAVAADVAARMRQFQTGRGMAECLTAAYGA